MLDFLSGGRKAVFRRGLRRIFDLEFKRDFSPSALDLLCDEATAYLFRYASGPRYGDVEYVIAQARAYLARLNTANAGRTKRGQIGSKEILRLRQTGALASADAAPPWKT